MRPPFLHPASQCCCSQSALSQGPLLLARARIALAKSRSKWAARLYSQRCENMLSGCHMKEVPDSRPVIYISGRVSFGGIEII